MGGEGLGDCLVSCDAWLDFDLTYLNFLKIPQESSSNDLFKCCWSYLVVKWLVSPKIFIPSFSSWFWSTIFTQFALWQSLCERENVSITNFLSRANTFWRSNTWHSKVHKEARLMTFSRFLIVQPIKFLEITNVTDLQSFFLDLVSSNNELANFLVWDFLLVAVFVRQIQSLDTKLSFQAARLVVNSCMNYSAKRFVKISTKWPFYSSDTHLLWPDWWYASFFSFSMIAILRCGCLSRISLAELTPTIPPPTQTRSNFVFEASELRHLTASNDLGQRDSNILDGTIITWEKWRWSWTRKWFVAIIMGPNRRNVT